MKREVSYETFTKESSVEKRLKASESTKDLEIVEKYAKWLIKTRQELRMAWTKCITQSSSETRVFSFIQSVETEMTKIDKLKGTNYKSTNKIVFYEL